ncbi:DNA polymerase IV, partial [Candidatus Daviesbacteria bacterium]|nr:DNA polymerase IV [Candidatus Daviesbacteria bacterium]
MHRAILHIDFNSYFATVEQQANPRLRGKPVGVTGGDRLKRTVLGAASVEAKRFGVKTGMQIWQAKQLCPSLILVPGDSDKYLECTKRFLAILKDYSPYLEVFSIDECFLQCIGISLYQCVGIAKDIKREIREEIGEWITCSIGISYNKLMAKLAGSLQKPDGLVVIEDTKAAMFILDRIELDEICGIGPRIKKRLNNIGIFNFKQLRQVPKDALLASFKSYGQVLYNMARGIDHSEITPFYEKEEVKSIGHRHTIDHDTDNPQEIKQILLKLTELIARRLRAKNLVGKAIHCWYRLAFEPLNPTSQYISTSEAGVNGGVGSIFVGEGMQTTIAYTNDGLEIFKAAWKIFDQIWDRGKIRMIGVSISN